MATKELSQYRIFQTQHEMEKAISTLHGMIQGMSCDRYFSPEEVSELKSWVECHKKQYHPEPLNSLLHLVSEALEDNKITQDEFDDICWACDKALKREKAFDPSTIALQVLHGIMHGALADGYISDDEIGYLQNWIYDFDFLKGSYPYDELDSLITSILSDGKITSEERDILKAFFSDFALTDPNGMIKPEEINALKEKYCLTGICATCPEIIFSDHVFCFTGISSRCSRKDISEKVQELGGAYIDRVSNKIDYLIIGNNGNPCFAYSCYGRKVEQAVNMRKQGGKIILVHENDFWDEIE